ncbi:type I-E CRISPR-associated protein Cas5/CasD [Gordonia sp. DT101]|uniref:type I-E CRISPR-associated protein Cas5/CasD n=1 Tax=Gordonia sp. DT101 TaxID=3416545 RepID=UPI003CF1FB0B
MSTLVICLAGPMQSWGASSRFTNRGTRTEPTKSGVLGLLAAAQGIRRSEDIEHLLDLNFGVRVDQEGSLARDFQVARSLDGTRTMPLSVRYYLADAVFVGAVEGDASLISALESALSRPTFPLYLGRRSCPPSRPVYLRKTTDSLRDALSSTPWQASEDRRRRQANVVTLRAFVDGMPGVGSQVRDVPVSFDPRRREYSWRTVEEISIPIDNSNGRPVHDPMALLGGG